MKKHDSRRLNGLWLGAALLMGAAMSNPAQAVPPRTAADETLAAEVLARLNADKELGGDRIRVISHNGVVTLRGQVPSVEAATRAIKLAEATHGVRGVWVEFVADD